MAPVVVPLPVRGFFMGFEFRFRSGSSCARSRSCAVWISLRRAFVPWASDLALPFATWCWSQIGFSSGFARRVLLGGVGDFKSGAVDASFSSQIYGWGFRLLWYLGPLEVGCSRFVGLLWVFGLGFWVYLSKFLVVARSCHWRIGDYGPESGLFSPPHFHGHHHLATWPCRRVRYRLSPWLAQICDCLLRPDLLELVLVVTISLLGGGFLHRHYPLLVQLCECLLRPNRLDSVLVALLSGVCSTRLFLQSWWGSLGRWVSLFGLGFVLSLSVISIVWWFASSFVV